MKHSPRPWAHRTGIENELITDAAENIICRAPNNPENGKLWHLDAPLIVRSVNALPRLIDVLKEARLQIEYLRDKFGETGSGNAVLARISDVLKEADR